MQKKNTPHTGTEAAQNMTPRNDRRRTKEEEDADGVVSASAAAAAAAMNGKKKKKQTIRRSTAAEEGGGDGSSSTISKETMDKLGGVRPTLNDLTSKFYTDFRQFIFANNVVAAAAGFSIGTAIKQLIQEIMDKIVLPVLVATGTWIRDHTVRRIMSSGVDERSRLRFLFTVIAYLRVLFDIVWSVVVFVAIVLLTFVVLEYIINKRILGLRTRVRTEDRDAYAAARAKARVEGVVPTAEIAERVCEENSAELLRGMAVLDDEMADSSERIALYKKDTAHKAYRALDVLEGDDDKDDNVGKKGYIRRDTHCK